MNIYVGNLPRETTEEELKDAFAEFGEVESVTIIKDKFTGASRQFGFIIMPNEAEAENAINNLNEKELQGNNLTVNKARPKKDFGNRDRGSGRGFGGGRGGGFSGGRRR